MLPYMAKSVSGLSSMPRVLVLTSYSYGWESMPEQLHAFHDILSEHAKVDYIPLDTKCIKYEDVKADVYRRIIWHLGKGSYDYVIAADDDALRFVLEYRDRLFPGAPVVFEGINDEAFAHEAAKDPMITGIVESFPLKKTIALAAAIHPDAKHVVGISDESVSGLGSSRQFMACQESFPQMEFSLLDCSVLDRDEILQQTAQYGSDTILIYLIMTADAQGVSYSHTEAIKLITSAARVPVYKADELGLGNGILGGVMVSFYGMAKDAADIVLALDNGASMADFPVQIAKNYSAFDKQVMDRFHITTKQVSGASVENVQYINDEPSFFQQHKSVILPLSAVIVLLGVFAVFAVWVIHNKRQLVKQMAEKDLMLKMMLDNIPGGLVAYRFNEYPSPEGQVMYHSRGMLALTGLTEEEYSSWSHQDIFRHCVHPEDIIKLQQAVQTNVAAREPICLRFRTKKPIQGMQQWIALFAVWGYDEDDNSRIYYAFYLDVSQQEKAYKAENEARAAKASSEAKSQFFSRMSHDIRTPLNTILGFTALARDEQGIPPALSDYLNKINHSGTYLLALLNDVLDMAKIDSGKMELCEKSTDSIKFLNGIAEVFRAQAAEKGVRLVTDFSRAAMQWVVMDPLRSRQIYVNLLSNAVKFSQSGTEIHWTIEDVATGPDCFHTICTIRDQGCGMSKEFLARLFQPFVQGQSASAMNGTGLGLSIVKNLIDIMAGTIRVESELGQGTVFTVEIDRKIGQPQKDDEEWNQRIPVDLKGRRILLCEDNELNIEIATKLLEKAGCTVEVAENGQICVEKFAASPVGAYELILMDIRMPVMDGLMATKKIRLLERSDARQIPIIAMSADAFAEDVQRSHDAGMNAHLTKPVDPAVFYRVIASKLNRKV